MSAENTGKAAFDDRANPCACPPEVIAWLALGVKYAEASLGSAYPDAVTGAQYLKTFMEQPAEVWCSFISAERASAVDE